MKFLFTLAAAGAMALASAAANAALDDAQALELMKKGGCSSCHSVDKKVIGPAYHEVAAKHHGENGAAAQLENTVRHGSKGTYGAMPMPPISKLSDAELDDLVKWILTK